MSQLLIVSKGSFLIGKRRRIIIPPVCHVINCNNVPEKGRFICKYHWEIWKLLKDDWWSNVPCSERFVRYYCQ